MTEARDVCPECGTIGMLEHHDAQGYRYKCLGEDCFASWGHDGTMTFHHTSAAVKQLMDAKVEPFGEATMNAFPFSEPVPTDPVFNPKRKPPTFGRDPEPNTVSVRQDIFTGALDVLVWAPLTMPRNDSALAIEGNPRTHDGYSLTVCDEKHVHLQLGLRNALGGVTLLSITAYALMLTLDRAKWDLAVIQDDSLIQDAMYDCISTLLEAGAPQRFAEWLSHKMTEQMNEWVRDMRGAKAQLVPHSAFDA